MSRPYHCDECDAVTDSAITVLYVNDLDECDGCDGIEGVQCCDLPPHTKTGELIDPDDIDATADFCSWQCLSVWSTREAVEQAVDTL